MNGRQWEILTQHMMEEIELLREIRDTLWRTEVEHEKAENILFVTSDGVLHYPVKESGNECTNHE